MLLQDSAHILRRSDTNACLVSWSPSQKCVVKFLVVSMASELEAEVNMFEHLPHRRKIRARNKPGHYMAAPAKMIGCCAL